MQRIWIECGLKVHLFDEYEQEDVRENNNSQWLRICAMVVVDKK